MEGEVTEDSMMAGSTSSYQQDSKLGTLGADRVGEAAHSGPREELRRVKEAEKGQIGGQSHRKGKEARLAGRRSLLLQGPIE